jgi:hypothetical protein
LFLLLGSAMPAATPPSPGRNAEEAGLSAGQIRARASAAKYREAQDREMASRRRSGTVWAAIATVNAVRAASPAPPLH